ncbi:MAG: hybrid sensor histidine kinase/response regulator [Campylobacterota bacterium]|nr:hybrid sensor histidine kinase/response regulator [Campylobacterota bacterium]
MKNEKILIVDDIEENIDILCEILKDYDLSMSLDGTYILEILNKNKPDLILLDVVMPNINGFEVCEIIKSDKRYKNIPIIFITAQTDPQSIAKGFAIGGVDYVTKPFNSNELLARIKTHLKLSALLKKQESMLIQQSKSATMGEMIDSIAHQWMQPLNLIQMKIGEIHTDSFLGKKIDDDYLENYTNNLYEFVTHMTTTLNEFRTFFRPDKVKMYFTINSVLKKVNLFLKDDLIKYDISLIQEIDDDFIICGYENEFIHIFLNLISNSKYAFLDNNIEKREIYIKVSNNTITIQDNAGGIPENIIDDIFNANITSKGIEGTGIGLYMTKQIVKKHNGYIQVFNKDDGAVFQIDLPLD